MSTPASASADKPAASNAKADKKDKKAGKGAGASSSPQGANPEYLEHRLKIWDQLWAEHVAARKPGGKIKVTLPDGKSLEAIANETSPLDIAKGISKSLAERVVVAKVNGELRDISRPLEADSKLELIDFTNPEGKEVYWHSSSHVLGSALERNYGCHLCIGPALEDGGFYYDCEMSGQTVLPDDFSALEKWMEDLAKQDAPFQRLELTKPQALEMFRHNKFKVQIVNKIPDNEKVSAYRCGPLIDLCRGPHVVSTGRIKAFAITKNSSAYWLGKAENESLQRVYGISFPDKKMLKEYQEFMRLAAERDHRKLGMEQELFFFHELSPGSCFFLPHGARVYNKLIDFIRTEYRRRGFNEVITPNVFNIDLWKTSGHYENYKENMFLFEVEKQDFGMKPMNCPGHCLMFAHGLRSYRDLPLRLADFGVLHRNEFSGALTGLTRVRRFQQDDAHIFCRPDQIKAEIRGALDFLQYVYGIFGFEFALNLSTRPEKYLGDIETWNVAEKQLEEALNEFGKPWALNPGDGAFYGPKIDIQLTDALRRKHQCATIQLDFQLPKRFGLKYKTDDGGFTTPVIIHRAILGSVERMFAVLLEHTGGKWPFWLSPRQVMVVPVAPSYVAYAQRVRDRVHEQGFFADVDDGNNQLNKKIREAQLQQYNFILVVGEDEEKKDSVTIRPRDAGAHAGSDVKTADEKEADAKEAAAGAAKKPEQPREAVARSTFEVKKVDEFIGYLNQLRQQFK